MDKTGVHLFIVLCVAIGLIVSPVYFDGISKTETVTGTVQEVRLFSPGRDFSTKTTGCRAAVDVDGVIAIFVATENRYDLDNCGLLRPGDKVRIRKFTQTDGKVQYRDQNNNIGQVF